MALRWSRPPSLVACAVVCASSLVPTSAWGHAPPAGDVAAVASPLDRGVVEPVAVIDDAPPAVEASSAPFDASRYTTGDATRVAPEPRIAERPRTGKGLLIAGGTVLGAGIALTIAFGAMTRGCREDGPLACRYRSEDTFLLPLGITVITSGVMLMAIGGGYFGHYRRWQTRALAGAPASAGRWPAFAADPAGAARF